MAAPQWFRSSVLAIVWGAVAPVWVGPVLAAPSVVRPGPEWPVTHTDLATTAANNSPMLLADPTDSRFVVAAHRVDSPFFGCGLAVSGDGGRGWIGADPVPTLPEGAERCYAPEVAFDDDGVLYYLFIGLRGAGNEPMGVFLTTSATRGRSFDVPRMVLGPQNYMVRMVIDRALGQAGRLHLAWLHAEQDPGLGALPSGDNPILSAHSDDGGRTFSPPVRVSDQERQRSVAPALLLGDDHALHVAYYDLQEDARDYQGLVGPTWDGTWSLVVASSFDGGKSFGAGVVVTDQIGPPGRVMLIFTMSPPTLAGAGDGDLYVAWPDAGADDDPDVLLSRSGDGGRSWEPPVRLNDDDGGRRVTQELPRLAVAPEGRIDAAFLDRRNDPEDRRFDVYYTSSIDGGRTFAPNARLTTEPSDSLIGQRYQGPAAEGLVERGGRIGVLSTDGSVVVAWPDTRNASFGTNQQDIFAIRVVIDDDSSDSPRTWLFFGAGVGLAVVLGVAGAAAAKARSARAHAA